MQRNLFQKRGGVGAASGEAIASAMFTRLAFTFTKSIKVLFRFDLLPLAPAPIVTSHFLVPVEQAHRHVGRDQRQGFSHQPVRNRVGKHPVKGLLA